MAKKTVNPDLCSGIPEDISEIDVESGMTDFIIKKTLVNAETEEVVSVQKIRETAPTGEVASKIDEAVTKVKRTNRNQNQ